MSGHIMCGDLHDKKTYHSAIYWIYTKLRSNELNTNPASRYRSSRADEHIIKHHNINRRASRFPPTQGHDHLSWSGNHPFEL